MQWDHALSDVLKKKKQPKKKIGYLLALSKYASKLLINVTCSHMQLLPLT